MQSPLLVHLTHTDMYAGRLSHTYPSHQGCTPVATSLQACASRCTHNMNTEHTDTPPHICTSSHRTGHISVCPYLTMALPQHRCVDLPTVQIHTFPSVHSISIMQNTLSAAHLHRYCILPGAYIASGQSLLEGGSPSETSTHNPQPSHTLSPS